MFIFENCCSKFMIMSLWAPALNFPAENSIPKKYITGLPKHLYKTYTKCIQKLYKTLNLHIFCTQRLYKSKFCMIITVYTKNVHHISTYTYIKNVQTVHNLYKSLDQKWLELEICFLYIQTMYRLYKAYTTS